MYSTQVGQQFSEAMVASRFIPLEQGDLNWLGGWGVFGVSSLLTFARSARVWRVDWWLASIWHVDCFAAR